MKTNNRLMVQEFLYNNDIVINDETLMQSALTNSGMEIIMALTVGRRYLK